MGDTEQRSLVKPAFANRATAPNPPPQPPALLPPSPPATVPELSVGHSSTSTNKLVDGIQNLKLMDEINTGFLDTNLHQNGDSKTVTESLIDLSGTDVVSSPEKTSTPNKSELLINVGSSTPSRRRVRETVTIHPDGQVTRTPAPRSQFSLLD